MIKHWNEPRGVGGIFYDDLCTGDWEADFAFTQDVGRAFLDAFVPVTERHMAESWTDAEREIQLVKRGRYAEFNLVYDRGTQFGGLQTGHNGRGVWPKGCLPLAGVENVKFHPCIGGRATIEGAPLQNVRSGLVGAWSSIDDPETVRHADIGPGRQRLVADEREVVRDLGIGPVGHGLGL